MHIITDVNKISKTIQRNLTFILMLFQNLAFILPSFQQFLLKRMLVFSHKMIFIKNETALLCVTMRERARTFWHGNKTFPKGSSQYEIVPLLVVFHLPYSKYKGVKICFYSCHYQNQNFSLLSHSCHSGSTRVALVPFVLHLCRTRVASVSLVSHS